MSLKDYIVLSKYQQERLEKLKDKYKQFYNDPKNASPLFVVSTPVACNYTTQQMLDNPLFMLEHHLDIIKPHLEAEDDYLPAVRVNFGTAQIPAAFGCELFIPEKTSPAAKNHIMKDANDVYKMTMPALDAGLFEKLEQFTKTYIENLPMGIEIQHPDIQSPFNSAHLIRGNDIMLDFYDNPEALDNLLDLITDYMIKLVPYLKNMISQDKEWFVDWSGLWKGGARISNCSMQMINPEMYIEHVFPRDLRLMEAIGGGRIHYCGTSDAIMDEFFKNPLISCIDYDGRYHDLWDMCERAPEKMVLFHSLGGDPEDEKVLQRLLNGEWPAKRNIVLQVSAQSVDEGKKILKSLRESVSKI